MLLPHLRRGGASGGVGIKVTTKIQGSMETPYHTWARSDPRRGAGGGGDGVV